MSLCHVNHRPVSLLTFLVRLHTHAVDRVIPTDVRVHKLVAHAAGTGEGLGDRDWPEPSRSGGCPNFGHCYATLYRVTVLSSRKMSSACT